jgi:hypothetical protein
VDNASLATLSNTSIQHLQLISLPNLTRISSKLRRINYLQVNYCLNLDQVDAIEIQSSPSNTPDASVYLQEYLDLKGCTKLTSISSLGLYTRKLNLSRCYNIRDFSELSSPSFAHLESLDLS